MLSKNIKMLFIICATLAALVINGCATGPKVRSDFAADTNFAGYKTFAFMPTPATDNAEYSTLITQHFKNAISTEMAALGYQYNETSPDLLINFKSHIENRTDVRSSPSVNFGYYHYRRGFYAGFPIYNRDVDTIHYKHGSVNIDVVDAHKKQLIWEGVSEGTLNNSALENPKASIANVVNLIFQKYPTRTATSPN